MSRFLEAFRRKPIIEKKIITRKDKSLPESNKSPQIVTRIKSTGEVLNLDMQDFFYCYQEELILEGEPSAEDRRNFQNMLNDNFLVLDKGEVKIMRTTADGHRYCQGSIDLKTGYVHSSEPVRIAGSFLYMVRELAEGKFSVTPPPQKSTEINDQLDEEGKVVAIRSQSKVRNPYAPLPRKKKRFL